MIKKRVDVALTDEEWELAKQMFKSHNDKMKRLELSETKQTDANIVNYLITHAFSNCSRNQPKAHNERGAGRKRLPISHEQVQALRDSGLTAEEIAKQLNTSISTVKRILHPNLRN